MMTIAPPFDSSSSGGCCALDKARTDLFFDVIDRRSEKDMPNALILTSNTPVNN